MSIKNTVKVMNFHALLRVPEARRRVDLAFEYERELKYIISSIVNNRIFKQEHVSLDLDKGEKELNIYLGSDLGFCANFNSNIISYLRADEDKNDKIIIGRKIRITVDNEILFIANEEFDEKFDDIFDLVLDGLLNYKYSKVNLIYTHYYNISRQEMVKRTILPFDYGGDILDEDDRREINKLDDFVVEGDLNFIIWNLISIYVTMEIKIAKAWSYATENVQRQTFTDNSLKKIDEREEEKKKKQLKQKKAEAFKTIVEMNNRKLRSRKESDE